LAVDCAGKSQTSFACDQQPMYFSYRYTMGWNTGAVRVLKTLIQLFSEVFCVDRAVHTFHFKLVTKATPNKRWLIFVTKSKSSSGRNGLYLYSRTLSRDSSYAKQISCILLRKLLQNSMSIKYVLSFQLSPRATKFCVTDSMLPARYEFTGPALTFVDGILLDGTTQLYSFRVQTL